MTPAKRLAEWAEERTRATKAVFELTGGNPRVHATYFLKRKAGDLFANPDLSEEAQFGLIAEVIVAACVVLDCSIEERDWHLALENARKLEEQLADAKAVVFLDIETPAQLFKSSLHSALVNAGFVEQPGLSAAFEEQALRQQALFMALSAALRLLVSIARETTLETAEAPRLSAFRNLISSAQQASSS